MPEGNSAVSTEMWRKALGLSNFLDRVCVCVVGQKLKILIYYRKTQTNFLANPISFICARKKINFISWKYIFKMFPKT